jgi:DNA-binding ferritin-like protein
MKNIKECQELNDEVTATFYQIKWNNEKMAWMLRSFTEQ